VGIEFYEDLKHIIKIQVSNNPGCKEPTVRTGLQGLFKINHHGKNQEKGS